MDRREQEFFEWFDQIEDIMKEHDIPAHQVVNVREVWDIAWKYGEVAGMEKSVEIVKGDN
jgi:hypothetical protein